MAPPRSPEPVFFSAWVIVSTLTSPWMPKQPMGGDVDRFVDTGLPSGFLLGEVSIPLSEADLLFGGEVPAPPVVEETGERIGDGDRWSRLPMEDKLVRPARRIDSREPASPA